MKTLLLLRHAKSDWDADFRTDHDRPLSRRGRQAARDVGRLLHATDLVPDLALVSTAVRAEQTYALAAEHGQWNGVVRKDLAELYGAGPPEVDSVLSALEDGVGRVLLVGHEPGWSATVQHFTGAVDVHLPTASLVRIDFDVDRWSDCRPRTGSLEMLLPARMLRSLFSD